MRHIATDEFWDCYDKLPKQVQELADKNYDLLKQDSKHPSLHFKKIGRLWSVRVGIHFRALGIGINEDVVWFWIGSHADYDKLIERQ